MKTIRRGDKGKEVKTAQQLLNHKGYGAGSVDGIFGENTEKAVRALQKNYGITVDGIIGTDTWDSLEVDGVLKQGARGPKVRGLQNELNARGFQAGTADGIFGSKTQAAVKALQKAGGIAADGIVGPDTWAALYAGTPGGAQPASAHFKASEFKCHDGTEVPAKFYANLQKLMALLEQIRTACGGRAVIINSGYRTAAYNKKVGGAPLSQHLLAKAADIRVEGMTAKQVYDIANRLNPNGGVGKYASFTHVDVRDGRAGDKAKAIALVSGEVHGIRRGDGQVAGHRAGDLVGIMAASAAMAAAAGTARALIKEHGMFLLFRIKSKVSFRYTLCPQARRCADYTGRI